MQMILSDEVIRLLDYAADEAMRTGSREISPDHLLLAIIRDGENTAAECLRRAEVDQEACKAFIEERISCGVMVPYELKAEVTHSRDVSSIMNLSVAGAQMRGSDRVAAADVLVSVLKMEEGVGKTCLKSKGITSGTVSLIWKKLCGAGEEVREANPQNSVLGYVRIPKNNISS